MSNVVKATVAICTFNGAERLPELFKALAEQTVPQEQLEILVIDNASTDNTQLVCKQAFNLMHRLSCRVVLEPRAGLSFARARAACEALGQVLLFLDDDNIPSPNWASSAIQAFERHPSAGVIGGKVIARWEVTPTPLAIAVAPFALAICNHGDNRILIDEKGGGIVGAGLCVRTELLRNIYKQNNIASSVTGRTGGNLMSGEDLAISVIARAMGWKCLYIPQMQIEHRLPASRMEMGYLLKLYEGIGRGQAAVRCLYDWKMRTPLRVLIAAKDYIRWQVGNIRGPSKMLRKQYAEIADEMHRLQLSLILGRASEAYSFPKL